MRWPWVSRAQFEAERRGRVKAEDVGTALCMQLDTVREVVRNERKEAARWRDRALANEASGPTCADVQAIYEENVRLRALVESYARQLRDTLPEPGQGPKYL